MMQDNTKKAQKISCQSRYDDRTFYDVNMRGQTIEGVVFENCEFIDCNFRETFFCHCRLIDCYFKSSDLSLVKLSGSSFNAVEFDSCKMTGINWTQVRWPSVTLASPVYFKFCDISLSSFYDLKLSELSVTDCKAHDVDFRGCDLTSADFTKTDLAKSQFIHTKLNEADFRQAINYLFHPLENSISQAKFSIPDVINLLRVFDIEIEGMG